MEDQIKQGWRKSSYSGNGGGDCVEVGRIHDRIVVRDTKDRHGPVLGFAPGTWQRFTDGIKRIRSLGPGRRNPAGPASGTLVHNCPLLLAEDINS